MRWSLNFIKIKTKTKMTIDKFQHLDSVIDAQVIENMPVHLLNEDRLPESKTHFQKIKEKHSSNIEIVNAANSIIVKIDNIMNLWNSEKIIWEFRQAANDENYLNQMAA